MLPDLAVPLPQVADVRGDLGGGLEDVLDDHLAARVAPAAGAPGDPKDVGRLLEGQALDGQVALVQVGGGHATERDRSCWVRTARATAGRRWGRRRRSAVRLGGR